MPMCGFVADALRRNKVLSTTSVRRIFHFWGQVIPAGCLVAVGYVGCDVYAAVGVLVLAVGSTSLAQAGFQVNHIDLSTTFSGTLMGLTNTLATIPGIVGKLERQSSETKRPACDQCGKNYDIID
jgi:MFS transporter, ACS family, solute carrier family 17 (sodium-dependent inorganic phosphate cotransporter), member 5